MSISDLHLLYAIWRSPSNGYDFIDELRLCSLLYFLTCSLSSVAHYCLLYFYLLFSSDLAIVLKRTVGHIDGVYFGLMFPGKKKMPLFSCLVELFILVLYHLECCAFSWHCSPTLQNSLFALIWWLWDIFVPLWDLSLSCVAIKFACAYFWLWL